MTDWSHALLREIDALKGYVERGGPDGKSGNIVKMWTDLDPALQGGSWCAVTVSWLYARIGRPLPAMDRPYGYMNCNDGMVWAKQHGWWDASGHYEFGDAVIYGWHGDGVGDHTGVLLADDGTHLTVAEGNTSPDDSGNQTNGGGFYIKRRPHSPLVLGVIKTSRLLVDTPEDTDMPLTEADVQKVGDYVLGKLLPVVATHQDMKTLLRGDAAHPYSLTSIGEAVLGKGQK